MRVIAAYETLASGGVYGVAELVHAMSGDGVGAVAVVLAVLVRVALVLLLEWQKERRAREADGGSE